MKKRICIGLLLSCIVLAGCGRTASPIEFDSIEDAKEALSTASSVVVKGDLEEVNQQGDILADDKVAAYVIESGFFDTKWTVSVDGEDWFYVKYVTDEPINNMEGVNSGSTYGYYDLDDNCLGYAQDRIIETDALEREYYMVFLDAEGNPREDYLAEEKGRYLYDYDGNVIGEGYADMDSFFSDACHVEVQTDTEMNFMDKFAMYMRLFFEYKQ